MTNVTAMIPYIRLATALTLCAALSACSAPKFKSDFNASVTFTPAAAAALKATNETATLEAYYYGAPTDATRDKANEAGQIEMGLDQVAIDPTAPSVHVTGAGIDQVHLTAIADGKLSVELHVHSGSDRADVIKCTTATATLSDLQAKPATIACDAA